MRDMEDLSPACTAHIPSDKGTWKRMGFSVQAPLLKHAEHHLKPRSRIRQPPCPQDWGILAPLPPQSLLLSCSVLTQNTELFIQPDGKRAEKKEITGE